MHALCDAAKPPHTPTPTHQRACTRQAAVLVVAIELTKLRVKRRLAHEKEQVWEEANYVYGAFLRLAFFRLKVQYITSARDNVVCTRVYGWIKDARTPAPQFVDRINPLPIPRFTTTTTPPIH